jgi:hypothetical protein
VIRSRSGFLMRPPVTLAFLKVRSRAGERAESLLSKTTESVT